LEQAGFRVLDPDMGRFGQATYPSGRLGSAILASAMRFLLETLSTEPVCAIRISMDGTISRQLVLDFPSLVE
jgi:hypothetical protein